MGTEMISGGIASERVEPGLCSRLFAEAPKFGLEDRTKKETAPLMPCLCLVVGLFCLLVVGAYLRMTSGLTLPVIGGMALCTVSIGLAWRIGWDLIVLALAALLLLAAVPVL